MLIETPEMRQRIFAKSKGKCCYCSKNATQVISRPGTPAIKFLDRKQLRADDFCCVCDSCLNDVEFRAKAETGTIKNMVLFSESGLIEYR